MNNIQKHSSFPKGFTLVEILITATVSSLILLVVVNTLLSGLRGRTQSGTTLSLQKTSAAIASDLSSTARWSKKVDLSNNQITVTDFNDQDTIYKIENDNLMKTLPSGPKSALNPANLKVTNFTITPYTNATQLVSFDVGLGLADRKQPQQSLNTSFTIAVRINIF